ncbi:MAG TPA: class Ib ribonucleoside-diphosphate reductase assembly flavoprotein NrdI [Candidatus Acetatifactor stercoripullorum]|uniref:Class Ib ribonucleoside-diphosphate reductase assembly flavoprotein NrdI n=1 Tax=Candidatus Acetatifactor stercoripullorum TaxID=2838414 RepID=A0A9D1R4A4_9FIRM|nr:class Ib ribonucleoside-diphosphate reductase assembly flavoprotein NrdI [Candidatus Acetatifactor stercoripullorum]
MNCSAHDIADHHQFTVTSYYQTQYFIHKTNQQTEHKNRKNHSPFLQMKDRYCRHCFTFGENCRKEMRGKNQQYAEDYDKHNACHAVAPADDRLFIRHRFQKLRCPSGSIRFFVFLQLLH